MPVDRRGVMVAGVGIAGLSVSARSLWGAPVAAPPDRVAVSDFRAADNPIQNAIDSTAREVVVDIDVRVAADVTLRSDQQLRFAGGRIIVAAGARIAEAVLRSRGGWNIALINPVIDAGGVKGGVPGIRLVDVGGARIVGGRLRRANLRLESYDNGRDRAIEVADLTIDMGGYAATAVYLSGIRGVAIRGLDCFDGLEGVGVYNGARRIGIAGARSHGHRQDGFLINAGQEISHSDCQAHGNGQSGFTTQRQIAGTDSRAATWEGCEAWDNVYDGFDIRGATGRPWGVDTGFVLRGCTARTNGNCGFYIVKAEGAMIDDSAGIRNRRQNLFIDTSERVVARRFRSISGASQVPSGPNKAGILVYDSGGVLLDAPVSGNGEGVTQDYGVAFTGASRGGRITGGDFSGNRAGPLFAGPDALKTR